MTTPFRLLLVDANTSWLPQSGQRGASQAVLPLGLMYLSAAAKRAFGQSVTVQIINTAIDCLGDGEFARALAAFQPDVVGFRALSVAADFLAHLTRLTSRLCPGVPLVAGGPHPSAEPADVLAQTPVSYVVQGEGERSLVELLEHLLGRREADAVSGLVYRRGDEIVRTPRPSQIADLDSIPWPDYDAIDQTRYASVLSYAYTLRPQGLILSSRGCPFRCKYCFRFLGTRYRERGVDSVVDEIRYLSEVRGIRDIAFVDDTFNLKTGRVAAIFEAVLRSRLDCRFYFPAGLRPDLMTPDLADLLIEAGTCWITYAVDTVVPRLQRLVGRAMDGGRAAALIDHTAGRDILVGLFLMVGFPTETYAEAMTTLRFAAERRRVALPYFFTVKYFPETELTRLALRMGAIEPSALLAARRPYHDVAEAQTSTLSNQQFQELRTFYLKEILLDRARLTHALAVQERHLSRREIAALYSALLGRPIDDPRRAFRHALAPAKENSHGASNR